MPCSTCNSHPRCSKVIGCQQTLTSSQWFERLFRGEDEKTINALHSYANRKWSFLEQIGGSSPEELVNTVLLKISDGTRNIPNDLTGREFVSYVCTVIHSVGSHEYQRIRQDLSRQVKTSGEIDDEDDTETDYGWEYEHNVCSSRDKVLENNLIVDEIISRLRERISSNTCAHEKKKKRLLEVLRLKLIGESGSAIAKQLGISPATVSEDERDLKIITIRFYCEQGFLGDLVDYPILKPFKRVLDDFEAQILSSKPPHYRTILRLRLENQSLSHIANELARLYQDSWSSGKVSMCLTEMLSWLLNPSETTLTETQSVAEETVTITI